MKKKRTGNGQSRLAQLFGNLSGSQTDLRLILAAMRMSGPSPISAEEAYRLATEAIERARARHPDFDKCVPFLLVLTLRWIGNWKLTNLDETLELCIVALKHADFTSEMRQDLARRTAA